MVNNQLPKFIPRMAVVAIMVAMDTMVSTDYIAVNFVVEKSLFTCTLYKS